jgi:Mrp family chromosome partitioning ATPase
MKPFDLLKRVTPSAKEKAPGRTEAGAPNDLRNYLQRSSALRSWPLAKEPGRNALDSSRLGHGKLGPMLKSLDAVLDHLGDRPAGDMPRAVLVMAARPEVDASREAIYLARAQASNHQLGVLVDLTRGAMAVSEPLGLPRAPGFAELVAGSASFEDVVQIDDETPLQVIAAGSPALAAKQGNEGEWLTRLFEALAQAYDFFVLHADRGTARAFKSLLAGRVQIVVAVLPSGEDKGGERNLLDLAAFGCPILPYEQAKEQRRFGRSGP